MKEIQKECKVKTYFDESETFTSSTLEAYTINAGGSNNCQGSGGRVSAIPADTSIYPTFHLAYDTKELTYAFKGQTGKDFTECLGLICEKVNSASLRLEVEASDFEHKDTYLERGCSALVLVDGPNWEDAQANAENLGGNLATINDSDEWDWFKNEYVPERYAYSDSYNSYPNGEVQLWLGLSDVDSEGEPTWASGESSDLKPIGLDFKQGASPTKDNYGVWQWEKQRITTYDKNYDQRKKDGWTESQNNIRGLAEIPICQ